MESCGHASLFLLLLVVHNATANSDQHPTQNDDMQTMRALSNLVPAARWSDAATGSSDPCTWTGVGCTATSHSSQVITTLSLARSRLPANITDTSSSLLFFDLLCQLNSLQSLDLSLNHFTYIPASFLSNCSGLPQLRSLNLSSNYLAGTLGNFSSFPGLETLDLSSNQLRGDVGVLHELHGLANLKSLNLSHNLFDGTIPLCVGLRELVLSKNNFSGRISNDMLKLMTNLTLLDLGANSLSGSIPDGIRELSKLQHLQLSYNLLTGEIPASLASITSLQWFDATNNKFVGTIPAGITKYIKRLDLSYNMLTGGMSSDLLSPPTLFSVDLSYNLLQGPIPANISLGSLTCDLVETLLLVLSQRRYARRARIHWSWITINWMDRFRRSWGTGRKSVEWRAAKGVGKSYILCLPISSRQCPHRCHTLRNFQFTEAYKLEFGR